MRRYRSAIRSRHWPLPSAPSPIPGEGLLGYRLRLTEANRYRNPLWIYDGPVAKTLLQGYENLRQSDFIDQLALLTAVDWDVLARTLLFPKKLYIRSVNLTRPRICPKCLSETAFLRKSWDLSLLVACPVHQCYLVDHCPSCKMPIPWLRAEVAYCGCGFDLRSTTTMTVESSVLSLTKRIAAAAEDVGITEYGRQPQLRFNDSFPDLDLPLDELCTLIMFLGGLGIHGIRRKTFMQPRMIELPYARNLVLHTAELFQAWPTSLKKALGQLQLPHRANQYAGLRARFGYMYMYLYNNMLSHHFDFLRSEFEEYVRDNFVGLLGTEHFSKLSPRTRLQPRYVSASIAARRLKIPVAEVRRLVQVKTLSGTMRRDKSGRFIAFVEHDALEHYIPPSRDLIYLEGARKLLGLEKFRARELMRSKSLREVFGCSRGVNRWRISRSKTERLLADLCANLPELKDPIAPGLKTVRNLSACYLTGQGHFPYFLDAVLKRTISPVGIYKSIPGLNGLVFRLADVMRLVESQYGLKDHTSIEESVDYLQLEVSYVYRLIDAGFLRARLVPIGFRGRLYVQTANLLSFKQRFITLGEIIRLTGRPRMSVRALLLRAGIKAVSLPRSGRPHLNVYLRKHVFPHLPALREFRSERGSSTRSANAHR